MTKKRTLLVLLAVAGLGLGGYAALVFLTTPEPAATMSNFGWYVHDGMSLRQVEAVLGPPNDIRWDSGRYFCEWAGEDGCIIQVWFSLDHQQAVVGVAMGHSGAMHPLRPPASLLDRVKSLLGL